MGAAILQYYFGAANAKFRPFLGLGVSYNWFSDLQLNTNFIKQTQDNLGAVLAAGAGKPGTTSVEAKASSSWQPVFNAGLQYNMTEHFGLIASVTYIPLKTTSTVTIKAADGTVLGVEIGPEGRPDHQLRRDDVQVLSAATDDEWTAATKSQAKARLRGGLNPYQRRHGGDRCNYSETVSAMQHFRRENKDFPSNVASRPPLPHLTPPCLPGRALRPAHRAAARRAAPAGPAARRARSTR